MINAKGQKSFFSCKIVSDNFARIQTRMFSHKVMTPKDVTRIGKL